MKNRKASTIQFGLGNKVVIYQNDGKNAPIPINNVFDEIYKSFKEEDEKINTLIPDGIKVIKTNETTSFSSEKILTSLIRIGMPIEPAILTIEDVIEKTMEFAQSNGSLSTQQIRRIVADAIRNIESVNNFESEEWSYRYTRKYGHDSRQVVIYNFPEKQEVLLSYSVVAEIIKDAFHKIIPVDAVRAIPRAHMDAMSDYIMEFVNGCDLYYLDYDILLNMIIELSRQPPHPWLITDNTRDLLRNYDIEAIQSNINKINAGDLNDGELYCYTEIIHHSSSLILQKYQWFLGADDFSAFNILKNILKKYSTTDFKEIVQMNNSIQKLERDLVLAGTTISNFQELLDCIDTMLRTNKIASKENRDLMLEFGNLAIDISSNISLNTTIKILEQDWYKEKLSVDSVFDVIFKVLCTLSHASNNNANFRVSDKFMRFSYENLEINGLSLKKHFFVLYVDNNDYSSAQLLNSRKCTDYGNVIFVICQNEHDIDTVIKKVNEITQNQYWCIPLRKKDLIDIIKNDSPLEYFISILNKKIS